MDTLTSSGEVRALLVLEQLPGVGLVTLRRLVDRFGSARSALAASAHRFAEVADRRAAEARRGRDVQRVVEEALARADRSGAVIISWHDARYPRDLWQLTDPPPVLFLKGRIELLEDSRAVTIVGARRATERGRDVAERLSLALSRVGRTVVSGLAMGVDAAAHRGALRGPGATIAVLGAGVDVPYPRLNARLQRAIPAGGLLVSEFLPGQGAAPHHFPRRNRILAALSPTTVVVEAGRRSGALITVDHALDLGRDVWAVPGPIDSPRCAGSNQLLVDGARPLVSIEDFVRQLFGDTAGFVQKPLQEASIASGESGDLVYACLGTGPLTVDEITARAGLPTSEVLARLTMLELHGDVERLPGMRFRRAA